MRIEQFLPPCSLSILVLSHSISFGWISSLTQLRMQLRGAHSQRFGLGSVPSFQPQPTFHFPCNRGDVDMLCCANHSAGQPLWPIKVD